jgi:L-asparaginase II
MTAKIEKIVNGHDACGLPTYRYKIKETETLFPTRKAAQNWLKRNAPCSGVP